MNDISSIMLQQIREVEQRDDAQVLAEIAGEAVSELIYETEVWDWTTGADGRRRKEKKRKIKLSWAGTREVARSRGNIVISDAVVSETDDYLRVVVKGTDLKRNFTIFGGCHQPKKMTVNDYDPQTGDKIGSHLEDDPYAFQKGLSKSQRNALQSCIPADYAAKMIDRFLRQIGKPAIAAAYKKAIAPKSISKTTINPQEWDKVKPDSLPDFPALERLIWDLSKTQPADMYRELGVGSRSDMTIPVWEAFLQLKERFVPQKVA